MKAHTRRQRASFGLSLTLVGGILLSAQLSAVQAQPQTDLFQDPIVPFNTAGTVYINEPLQGGSLSGWDMQGYNWQPQQTTVLDNNGYPNSNNTSDCIGHPYCSATRNDERDSRWLTLTTDNTRDGLGEASTALHTQQFSSDLGVVLEYDQRVYRTNNGRMFGTPATQGGGDGIAVYLVDAAPPNYGNSNIDITPNEPGGYGAGLGYSAVSEDGDGWCEAQQGVAGGFIGIGFDVYGNYQKADVENSFGQFVRATRPRHIAGGHPEAFPTGPGELSSSRVPQSIGLRGSGVRFQGHPDCGSTLENAYGAYQTSDPLVTNRGYHTLFQVKWNGADSASQYVGTYKVSGQPDVNVNAEEVPSYLLPYGFNDPNGYVMFLVPDSVSTFNFTYTNNGNSPGPDFQNINQDSSLGIAPGVTPLQAQTGGYKWLAGTGNLSTYPNPTTEALVWDNDASINGAVIDNTKDDSREYRRIRVTLTPDGTGAANVRVFWSQKLNVADDVCYSSSGVELSGRTANGTTDTCVNPTGGLEAGTWHYDRTQPLTFTEMFDYDLGESPSQAALPANFRLGFSASTGWAVNHHQIRNLNVTSVIDLEVEKEVAFIGDNSAPDGTTTWRDEDEGHPGDNVAYRVEAWNNGPGDLLPKYPATLTDGLSDVPFMDVDTVAWTATAQDGAYICADWDEATVTCVGDDWVTQLTGTGPLEGDDALRWLAPSRTAAGFEDAGVTVVFTGQVSDGASGSTPISAGQWYDNTAEVAASVHGGPQEDNLTNNTSSAQIRVLPALQVNKIWDVNGESYEHGSQPEWLDDVAQLELTPAPAELNGADPVFGDIYAYPLNQPVSINEVIDGVPVGCSIEGRVTSQNETPANAPLPYDHTIDNSRVLHVVEITNTVTCQSLTLRKEVLNPEGALSDTGEPGDWVLSATSEDDDTVVISEAPGVEVPGIDEVIALATATVPVAEGDYQLAEAVNEASDTDANLAAYNPSNWVCTYPALTPGEPDAVADAPVTPQGVVTVPQGADVTCEISNETAELSLLKWADASYFTADDFTLEIHDSTDDEILSVDGSYDLVAANSRLVDPSETFGFSELSKNPNLPYFQVGFERYTTSPTCPANPDEDDLSNPDCWDGVDADNVSVAPGERGIYRFINTAPNAPDMPLTGGSAANTYLALGLVIIAGGLCSALVTRWRGRVTSRV